jgi:hypothetical protein
MATKDTDGGQQKATRSTEEVEETAQDAQAASDLKERQCSSPMPRISYVRSYKRADSRSRRLGPWQQRAGRTSGALFAQFGICRISLAVPAEHVDHDHETGRVRGVLCFSCNAALGQFKDRPGVIRRAAAYPEGNAWKPTLVAPGVYQLPS